MIIYHKGDLLKLLPQKSFFNLLDLAVFDPDKKIDGRPILIATKTITDDDQIMQVHPWAYPGTILEEAVLQACQILALTLYEDLKDKLPAFKKSIRSENYFSAPVIIGDVLTIEVVLINRKRNVFYFNGNIIKHNKQKVLTVTDITAMVFPVKTPSQ